MTTMRRITISFDSDSERAIKDMKSRERYESSSLSKIVNLLVKAGYEATKHEGGDRR